MLPAVPQNLSVLLILIIGVIGSLDIDLSFNEIVKLLLSRLANFISKNITLIEQCLCTASIRAHVK